MPRYILWIRVSAILQIITGSVHALSFLRTPTPTNETERTLYDLMSTYHPDMGAHFHPSMYDILNALSSCFTFLYLFAGIVNLYLSMKGLEPTVWKGLVWINLMIFGAAFLVMALLTFLPPVILTGTVFLSLCLSYATNHIHCLRLPQK